MTLKVDLRQVIHALADALDLVGVDDVAHGKRVGVMAAECGRGAGLPAGEVAFLFELGMLHDIGVSSTRVHGHLVESFDWSGAQTHCQVGYERIKGFAPLEAMALPILYHHTRWDVLEKLPLAEDCKRQANLIYLVDRVDALAAPHYGDKALLLFTEEVRARIAEHAGSYFAPELVGHFLDASRAEAFWLMLEPRSLAALRPDATAGDATFAARGDELRRLGEIFATIVDAKSPFTAEHSLGVARLARYLGEGLGFDADHCDRLEIAALLHDLGKLRVPDEVLDKPGRLDARERKIINAHSFETFRILRGINGFEEIALWAACHHEEPDGSGYPFHLDAAATPLEARILRVADIFQAMVQARPYRAGMDDAAVARFMAGLVADGRCEADLVDALLADLPEARRRACPGASAVHQAA